MAGAGAGVRTVGVTSGETVLRPFESISMEWPVYLRSCLEIIGWPRDHDVPELSKLTVRPSKIAPNLHLGLARGIGRGRRRRLASALFRVIDSRFLPPARPSSPEQRTRILLRHAKENRTAFEMMPDRCRELAASYRPQPPTCQLPEVAFNAIRGSRGRGRCRQPGRQGSTGDFGRRCGCRETHRSQGPYVSKITPDR